MRHPAAAIVLIILATILLIVVVYVALFYLKKHHEGNPALRMEAFEIYFKEAGEPTKTDDNLISDPDDIITIPAAEKNGAVKYSDTIEVDIEVNLDPGTVEVVPLKPIPEPRSSLHSGRVTYQMPSEQVLKDWNDPLFEIEASSCYIFMQDCHDSAYKALREQRTCLFSCAAIHVPPGLSHRFKNVQLSCSFRPARSPRARKEDVPVVTSHAPRTAYGGYSKVESYWTYGISAPLQGPGGNFFITATAEKSRGCIVDHYMYIEGSARGTPKSKYIWTMAENNDSKAGLLLDF